jgi:hypothetical protein
MKRPKQPTKNRHGPTVHATITIIRQSQAAALPEVEAVVEVSDLACRGLVESAAFLAAEAPESRPAAVEAVDRNAADRVAMSAVTEASRARVEQVVEE